ncbi:MAG TPA: ABC transporter ATP-binding protein/permease [Deltaproteobacteria bacterium]|nr:ABC transporter ATP-binding protein/permease [Deltaproteobacteria bacterium]
MENKDLPIYKRSLFSWIFSGNLKIQVLLLGIVLITVFTRVLPLEMQKRIVNQAINLKKIDLLVIYCGIYLVSVLLASGLKFLINILQTRIAQRATAQIRTSLYEHILMLPLSFFRRTQPGMVVSALVTELATAGDFIGMAVAVPITAVFTLLAISGYLIWINPLLAIVSLSIYPFVLLVVPILQKKANAANKRRVDTTRKLSSKIGESISGIHEIHGHGAFGIENRKYGNLVKELEKIRVVWNLYRFAIKVSGNFFTNLSPFIVFILGGYLAINGQLELGALVAFLSAQEKIYDPWKELIDFYQAYQDASVSYSQTMNYFAETPQFAVEPRGRSPYDLEAKLEVNDLSYVTEEGIHLLDDINFSLQSGEHMALVGFSGSGKSTLALCIGQLYRYTGGHISIGGKEVSELTKMDMSHNIGFVSQSPFIFEGTLEENLLYSCMARIDGNGEGAGPALPTLDDMIAVLHETGIFVDVLRFGLNAVLIHDEDHGLEGRILRLREKFRQDYGDKVADYVELYDENRYLHFSSISGNITFGSARIDSFQNNNLSKNEYIIKFLRDTDLYTPLLELGRELCRQAVSILTLLPPDDLFYDQNPMRPEELEEYQALSERLMIRSIEESASDDREKLLRLAFRFTPGQHKIVALPPRLQDLILRARFIFRGKVMKENPGAMAFHQMDHYIYSQTILNNIFFGKLKTAMPHAQEKITEIIIQLLIEEDLLETIISTGMQYQVGTKGDKLSGGQRQKLAIARAFLKNPHMLILDEATSALDNNSQSRIQNLLEKKWKRKSTVIAVVHRLDIIKGYDKIAVMKSGKIGEIGTYSELMDRKGLLYELTGRKT